MRPAELRRLPSSKSSSVAGGGDQTLVVTGDTVLTCCVDPISMTVVGLHHAGNALGMLQLESLLSGYILKKVPLRLLTREVALAL